MSLEAELIEKDHDKMWYIQINIIDSSIGTKIAISIQEPYRHSLEDWRKITGGNCSMSLPHSFSLDDGYYKFDSPCDDADYFHIIIKEESLRDKLVKVIDKAVELDLLFGYAEDSDDELKIDASNVMCIEMAIQLIKKMNQKEIRV